MVDQIYLKFESLGGLDALEALQLSDSQEVYEKAKRILLTYFEEDLSQLGPLQSLFQ